MFHFSANFQRPSPTKAMMEHKETLPRLPYGRRSLSYLLHEDKLRACGLLGEGQSTSDWSNRKYGRWEEVPQPTNILPPRRERKASLPIRSRSPRSGNEANDEASSSDSGGGKTLPTSRMWSPTLLKHRPNRLVSCPQNRYHFYIWSWVDAMSIGLIVGSGNTTPCTPQTRCGMG